MQGVNSLRQDGGEEFLRNYAWYELSTLKLLLENHFHRITLVNKAMTERLTIDTGVHFHHLITGTEARLENLAIIELKRDGELIHPSVKYCANCMCGLRELVNIVWETVLTAGNLKYNRFKPKLRMAQKIAKKQLMNI